MNDTVNVPREPTLGMLEAAERVGNALAGSDASSGEMIAAVWSALLAAAPKAEPVAFGHGMLVVDPDLDWSDIVESLNEHKNEPIHPASDDGCPQMTLDEYQSRTSDTAIYPGKGTPLGLIYCGLKLAGESGEVAEKIGKAIRDDEMIEVEDHELANMDDITPERRQAIKGELGDVLWYVASLARELGFDLSDIAQSNIDKLADRKQRGVLGGDGDNR